MMTATMAVPFINIPVFMYVFLLYEHHASQNRPCALVETHAILQRAWNAVSSVTVRRLKIGRSSSNNNDEGGEK
jgi:hypothetical protein